MSAVAHWPADRRRRWSDGEYWERRIDRVIAVAEAAECNRCITVAHQELALALHEVTGPGSGANFHTWAVWGSRKAGSAIRQEEVPWVAAGERRGRGRGGRERRAAARAGAAATLPSRPASAGGVAGHAYASSVLRRASARILAGNVTVLDDIGRQTGRFIAAFWDPRGADRRRASSGSSRRSGRDPARTVARICSAPRMRATCRRRRPTGRTPRDELMLLGNLNAILHEHYRLDCFIAESLPRLVRRAVTQDLLDVSIGGERLHIGRDVPMSEDTYPVTLRTIETPALQAFLTGGRRVGPDARHDSGQRRARLDRHPRPDELHRRPVPHAPPRPRGLLAAVRRRRARPDPSALDGLNARDGAPA